MLFDLGGRRKRLVQVVYAALALLMGGSLVLLGVGSDAPGGLLDALGVRNSGDSGDSNVGDRLGKADERLRANPRDENALKEVARLSYQAANEDADPNTGEYGTEGKANLGKADRAWQRYLDLEPETPDDSLARLMIQAYSPGALNKAPEAARAAELVAQAEQTPAAYAQLTLYASLANQTRKADLAGQRAIELAPPGERKSVKQQIEQAKAAAIQAQVQQQQAAMGGAAPGGAAPPGGAPAPGGAAPPGGAPAPGAGAPVPGGRSPPPQRQP